VPVVTVSRTDALRIYVFVDQQTAPFVRVGDHAEVRVQERPGWSRTANVTRASGALDTRTRTMLTEVDVDNRDGAILPGSLVHEVITTQIPSLIQIPAEALITRADKTFVAVVDPASRIRYRAVRVADDDGQLVRLLEGLHEGERVVLSLGNDAEDGDPVQVVQ
jgi:RND family efflux transporter MFP subunit